jgi:hypothetical protein
MGYHSNERASMDITGHLEPYIEVEDKCEFCKQPKRRLVLQSHPRYEGFHDMQCGYCGKTPRIEYEKN